MTHVAPSDMQQQGKLAKPIKDKASTTEGDSEVTSSKCKKTTVLLSVSVTAVLLFLVGAYVIVSLTKLAALKQELTQLKTTLEEELTQLKTTLEEEITQLQSSTKSGSCQLPNQNKGRVKSHFPSVASCKFPSACL